MKFLPHICFIVLVLIYGCTKDFIEKDISHQVIKVNSPADSSILSTNVVGFWWEPVDGVTQYSLQVVRPAFSQVTELVADTAVNGNKISLLLQPGIYQWRIKGLNNGYSTRVQTYNLTVDSAGGLASQKILLQLPFNGFVTRNRTIAFRWSGLAAAANYQLVVNGGEPIMSTTNTATVELSSLDDENTVYSWKVRALNDNSATAFSPAHTFTVDRKAPQVSSLLSPSSTVFYAPSIQSIDTLKWTRSGVTNPLLDALYDTLFVAEDSLFGTAGLRVKMRVNQTYLPVSYAVPSLPYNSAQVPYYYWRLTTYDSAQNSSAFPATFFKFKLVP